MLKDEDIILSKLRFDRAKEFCEIADKTFKLGYYQTTNNRAYYAVFHSIRAVLAIEKAEFKSHGKTLGHFNKNYLNKGIFDKKFSQIITNASKARMDSDYNDRFIANHKETEKILLGAKSFLQASEIYLSQAWEKYHNQDIVDKAVSEIGVTNENNVTIKTISETLEEEISKNTKTIKEEKSKNNIKDLAVRNQEMKNFKAMVDKVNDRNYPIKINGTAAAENIMAQKISIGKQISNIRASEKDAARGAEKER